MSKRIAALAVVGIVTLSAGAALAAWTVGSSGTGSSRARSLPAGPTPTATAALGSTTVTVSFPQVSLNGSVLGSLSGGGYTVRRYDSGGSAQTIGSACNTTLSGSAATLSCAEANVGNGTWSYKVTPVLAGWKGAEGAAGTVTISVVPSIPSVPVLPAASDSGSSSTDKITNVRTPTVTGTADTGSTVTIYDGLTAVGSAAVAGGTYSVTTSPLADGVHSLTAKASNGGLSSALSLPLAITIDTTAPAVTVTSLGSGGGTSKVKVTGTASATDGNVTVYLCHAASCSPVTDTGTVSGSIWSYTTPANIGTGVYYAIAKQTDVAGNTGQTPAYGPYTR
ncbi:MAG TPA: Ig-like domain-containing protein [Acidimicrobiia bacterium]|nr:Ig-like domain-containing protein [Acidimicrobiia bacterium]